jgi:hypothetical protein
MFFTFCKASKMTQSQKTNQKKICADDNVYLACESRGK